MLPVLGGTSSTSYNLQRSVRLRSSASAYLSRTPASTGNRKTFTWSGWVKRGALGINGTLFANGNGVNANGYFTIRFNTNDTISIFNDNDGTLTTCDWSFTNVFRDVAAWYHLVLAIDTTQATQTNRLKLYVNGVQNTNNSVVTYPAQNSDFNINRTVPHQIGQFGFGSSQYFDGYLTEVNFIDGQALTPSSFGSTNPITGVWQPAPYGGAYGTNGFELLFTDNSALTTSSNVGLGKDFSGNGNYWTTNNISITSGTTYDSMTDVPTLTSPTAANFAVLNPLNNSGTLANANLTWNGTDRAALGTMALPITGKYYFEATCTTVGNFSIIGIADGQAASFNGVLSSANFRTYNSGGEKADSTRTASWGSTFTSGDVIGIAVDMDNGAIYFAKNNTWQASGVPTSGASKTGAAFTDLISSGKTWVAFVSSTNNNGVWNANHGQRPFAYTPPTGYVALNTYNLPTGTILKGNTVMDATLYSGDNNATQTIVNAAGFKPDCVWLKSRSSVDGWAQVDSVRGANKLLQSNNTNAESTTGSVTAFNSNGFTADLNWNVSGRTYIGYQWQAGQGTTSSNTDGTITSTVSVNANAGFSVVTFTAQSSGTGTVGHGLGVAPSLIISKERVTTPSNWSTYHASVGNTAFLLLNTTAASITSSAAWNNTSPTSSVFTLGSAFAGAGTMVAYCWTPIAGYSSFGSYVGNGSTDGPFIYTGFKPRFIMMKDISAAGSWIIQDSARNPYNPSDTFLQANTTIADYTYSGANIDFVSNGFKIRGTDGDRNFSGYTYIYYAFAENPFKNSLAE